MTEKLLEQINYNKILILKGARQTGKTTILKGIREHLDSQGKNTFYIAADMDFENKIFKSPEHLLLYLDGVTTWNDKLYLFIDEFQYIKNAGQFLKILFDSNKKLHLIISGSSSLEITKNSEFLTGRKLSSLLRRISFVEFLEFKNKRLSSQLLNSELSEWHIIYDVHQTSLELLYTEYSAFGAYPEILTIKGHKRKIEVLEELIATYLQKDVAGFLKISNTGAFNKLVRILTQETGQLLNKTSLAAVVGISLNTMNHYLDILEGTYVFEFIPPFFTNVRKEVSKMRKIILQDFGFNVAMNHKQLHSFDELTGQEAETAAALAIRHAMPKNKLYHYRTISKSEIDFIIQVQDRYQPLEVKFRSKIKHTIAFENFTAKYDCLKPILVTKDVFQDDKKRFCVPLPLLEHFLMKTFSPKTNFESPS
jgi:predicted AAA+ superfamily ATPase